MTVSTRVAIVGSAGRMGQRLAALIADRDDLDLVSALDEGEPATGLPDGVIATTDPTAALVTPDPRPTVAIDFSAPAACAELLPICAEHGIAYLVGSTGLESRHLAAVEAAAAKVPVVVASNCSIGVNLLLELAELAGARLGDDFDVEISELHHRGKRDAPSGTALSLAEAVRTGRGALDNRLGRAGNEPPRTPDQLGIAALRGGDVSGEHTVFFLGNGERVELTHRATSRDIFVEGALRAAGWLDGRAPGRYAMRDVLVG